MTKNYKLVELNNKSRKGIYIYVKKPNEKGKYYKKQKGIPIDTIIKYHQTKKQQKTLRPKARKHKRRRTIESTLQSGIKTVKTNDLTTDGIHRAKKRLFRNIVKDNEILELLITDHNLQKIKHRLDITITTKNKAQVLFTANKLNITPNQALQESKNILVGEDTSKSYQTIKKLKNKGWTITQHNKGKITNITMTITFRKA